MKIIQYLPYSFDIHPGGLEKIAQTISNGLRSIYSFEVVDVSSDISKSTINLNNNNQNVYLPSFELISGFPIPKIWSKAFWSNIYMIGNNKPDIIQTHTRFFLQSMIGGLIAKYYNIKRVHIEHGSGFVTGYPLYIKLFAWIFDRTIGFRIFRQCDQIITISQMHGTFIKKFTKKIPTVIYNPIDFSAQSKIINDIIHIGFVGRLVSLKGVDLLIKALAKIQNHKYICTIVGSGKEENILKNLVIEVGLSDKVVFVGASDRNNRLHKFDIFVNPSHQEGLPTSVVEALMARCIVVATDVGGTKEISDQEDLIIVKSDNVSALGIGIEKAFDNLDKSGKSYDIIMKKFGEENVLSKYKNVYDQLI